MQHKNLSREKKIKFLSDLSKGKATIKDFTPPEYDVWFVVGGSSYENEKSGEIISKDEFKKRTKDVEVITFK